MSSQSTTPPRSRGPLPEGFPLQKTEESMFEYACHEGNYSMFNALSGARAEERAQGPTDSAPLP